MSRTGREKFSLIPAQHVVEDNILGRFFQVILVPAEYLRDN